MADGKMGALYNIALVCDAEENNDEVQKNYWQKSNQNRLNQNFVLISQMIDELCERLSAFENSGE